MTILAIPRETLSRPYFASLAAHIANAIEQGELAPGARLPPQRQLADQTGFSLPTVTRAYEELERRGLIVGEIGRGTYVKAPDEGVETPAPYVPERPSGIIDMSIVKPVGDMAHVVKMKETLAALAIDLAPNIVLGSRPAGAFGHHRAIASSWLRLCGVEAEARHIQITNGGTPALTIALMAACPAGSIIATEETGLHQMLSMASYQGLSVRGIAIDKDGMIPEALDKACREATIRALFLLPNGLAPTAFVMSEPRRRAIVEVARRHDLQIIEDDALGPLVQDKPVTFHALAPERTLYITSFTKCVMPGLRVGYLVAPDRLQLAVENRQLVTNWSATALLVEIATRWVEDGTAMELVRWQRRALAMRHETVARLFHDIEYYSHPAALHVWVPLPGDLQEEEVLAHARQRNVAVARGAAFSISRKWPAIRISVGSTPSEELERGLTVIRELLQNGPEPSLFGF